MHAAARLLHALTQFIHSTKDERHRSVPFALFMHAFRAIQALTATARRIVERREPGQTVGIRLD
jgi:hypothetical protein